jgi:Stage II sporulation protein
VHAAIRRAAASLAAGLVVAAALPAVPGASTRVAEAAPPGNETVIAYIARGVGNGHGRGLSQWGAYGRAVDGGQPWTQILDTYYGGTVAGNLSPAERPMSVRLTAWDSTAEFGVIDGSNNVIVNGVPRGYPSISVEDIGANRFRIWGAAARQCPSVPAGWQVLEEVNGPVVLSTFVNESTGGAADGLAACEAAGTMIHYRGAIDVVDVAGATRVVNRLDVENYLRGVVPREVSASWGSAGGGAGMNALRAQAVAARSYAVSQNRYSSGGAVYAKTCDTSSCQVYGGAATRVSPNATPVVREHPLTDQGIAETATVVRRTPAGAIVSTEFSASNGPRTAGGSFPSVDDPWDDVPGNPLHRWTRLIDADWLASWCGTSNLGGIGTAPDPAPTYHGIWNNDVTGCPRTTSILTLRNELGFPSHGFDLVPVTRGATSSGTFSFIGDSVGLSVAADDASTLRILTDGMFPSATYDSLGARPTQGGATDGVAAANAVPVGTDLVMVELGYNDSPSAMASRIDALMAALTSRGVGRVAWVTVSERRTTSAYATTNAAVHAATTRWSNLTVLDWEAASDDAIADRWYADNVHLTTTGRAEFALYLRERLLDLLGDGSPRPRPLVPGVPLRVPVLGQFGVPATGVAGVALNVTAVNPGGPGWLRVWPCGSPEPTTSSVNYIIRGVVEPNAVVVPVDATGEICVSTMTATEVLVDVSGWFDAGLRFAAGRLVDTRDDGTTRTVVPGAPLRVAVLDRFGVPATGAVGVALNVTAVDPVGPGWLRVWPCGAPEPETSSVNYMTRGAVEPNAVVVPVDATGEICVSTMTATEVLVDVSGWFDDGLQFAAGRLVDTRDDAAVQTVVPGVPLRVPVAGQQGVARLDASPAPSGVALNVTAVAPTGPGYLRVWPCGSPEPETSSVNYMARNAIEPNAVVAPVDATGEMCVSTMTPTEVIVDVSGWFDAGVRAAAGRLVDTRVGTGPIPGR